LRAINRTRAGGKAQAMMPRLCRQLAARALDGENEDECSSASTSSRHVCAKRRASSAKPRHHRLRLAAGTVLLNSSQSPMTLRRGVMIFSTIAVLRLEAGVIADKFRSKRFSATLKF